MVAPPADDFWARVRGWQARGWAIGLHGYQHRYVTHDGGLVPLNQRSEFAGTVKDRAIEGMLDGKSPWSATLGS